MIYGTKEACFNKNLPLLLNLAFVNCEWMIRFRTWFVHPNPGRLTLELVLYWLGMRCAAFPSHLMSLHIFFYRLSQTIAYRRMQALETARFSVS